MRALAWIGYILGFGLMMGGQPEIGGVVFLFSMVTHWRWWVIAVPLGIVAFIVGLNLKNDA